MRNSTPLSASPFEGLYTTTFHELRVPISSINGYVSVLLTGELGRLTPRQREPLKRVQELCGRLTALIGNLLTLAKSGARQVQSVRKFLDVGQTVQEATRSLQGEVRRKRLRLVQRLPAQPVRFWGDANDLVQIVLNLLVNAVKFTPPRGRVEVEVALRPQEVLLQVSDTGVGISAADLPKIFQEFYHVDHPEVGAGLGSGLGLAIVRRVVDAYGGKIRVASRPGRGSRFTVTLPTRPERQLFEEFFEETWSQTKETGLSLGLILLQVRSEERRGTDGPAGRRSSLDAIEQILREHLRQEDRLFHLPGQVLLAVLVRLKPAAFSMLIQRLERTLEESLRKRGMVPAGRGAAASGSGRWCLAAVLAPRRRCSPARLLDQARRKLWRVRP